MSTPESQTTDSSSESEESKEDRRTYLLAFLAAVLISGWVTFMADAVITDNGWTGIPGVLCLAGGIHALYRLFRKK